MSISRSSERAVREWALDLLNERGYQIRTFPARFNMASDKIDSRVIASDDVRTLTQELNRMRQIFSEVSARTKQEGNHPTPFAVMLESMGAFFDLKTNQFPPTMYNLEGCYTLKSRVDALEANAAIFCDPDAAVLGLCHRRFPLDALVNYDLGKPVEEAILTQARAQAQESRVPMLTALEKILEDRLIRTT